MREPSYTLTAGPTGGWPSVEAAMGAPLVYDYDPLFLERFARTERKVAELFRTAGDVVLMQGEAVLGLEAAARALVRPGMTALNLVSGVYAKWFGIWRPAPLGSAARARVASSMSRAVMPMMSATVISR